MIDERIFDTGTDAANRDSHTGGMVSWSTDSSKRSFRPSILVVTGFSLRDTGGIHQSGDRLGGVRCIVVAS